MKITRAYKIKIHNNELILNLNIIHNTFQNELKNILSNNNINIDSFSDKEYTNTFRGEFASKLGNLIGKNYLTWKIPRKAKYFRMLADNVRTNFKSIKDRQQIASICEKFDWNYIENKEDLRKELTNQQLYPTFALIKNVCSSKKVPEKHSQFKIRINYGFSQDTQTIIQENSLQPCYKLYLPNGWQTVSFVVPHFVQQKNIVKFNKPSFTKEEDSWFVTIPYELVVSENNLNKNLTMGIDIGRVKPFSAIVVNRKTKEIISKELIASKNTDNLNKKIRRIESNRNAIYSKLDNYDFILKKTNNNDIINKKIRLELELKYLRRKIAILKKHLAQLMAKDVYYHAKRLNVGNIHLESLNFVENTGGKWDFSQQQEWIQNKLETLNSKIVKVNASHSSDQNPFSEEYELGKKVNRTIVFKDYSMDRDVIGAINIACRSKKSKNEVKRIIPKQTSKIKSTSQRAKVS